MKASIQQSIPLRRARESDLALLRSIYAGAVQTLGPTRYSAEQVDAWQAFAGEPEFADFILGVNTYLAVIGEEVAGFCGIADDGHVASVYVRPGWLARGVGTALLSQVLRLHPDPGSGRYYAEASVFSLPLFERCGFRRLGTERAERKGVTFERFLLERAAGAGDET